MSCKYRAFFVVSCVHQLNVWKLTALRGVIVACVYICSIELYARIINMKISCK